MRVSGNELFVTAMKACIGCGVPRGVAEELGHACVELALVGRKPLNSLLKALEGFDAQNLTPPDWIQQGEDWMCETLSVLPYGPTVVDFAQLVGATGVVKVNLVDFPDLIWGLAQAPQTQERGFEIFKSDENSITVRQLKSVVDFEKNKPMNGFAVDDSQWNTLQHHAAKILVPADDSNRADAGAGLTDND